MMRSGATLMLLSTLLSANGAGAVPVDFIVDPPDGFPTERIFLTGSSPALGPWKPDAVRLRLGDDGRHRARVELPPGACEFKFTRGGWETVETRPDGGESPNRRIAVSAPGGKVECAVAAWRDASPHAAPHTLTGDIREHAIRSRILGHDVRFLVYLPPGYERAGRLAFPLLYLQDGNNMFDAGTAFGGTEWRMDEALEALIRAKRIRPVVAVAVFNDAHRLDYYTFRRDPKHGGGKADLYLECLVREIGPYVAARYRILPGREHTAILGSSLGGLLSLYAVWRCNATFGLAGVVSPSIWWSDEAILKVIAHPAPRKSRLWIDMGTNEGEATAFDGTRVSLLQARKVRDRLRELGYAMPADYVYEEIPGGTHSEADWAARAQRVLLYLFGR